jgi:hypothetical protein
MAEPLPKIESFTEDDLKLAKEAGFDIRPYVAESPLTRKGFREITDEDKKVSWGDYGRAAVRGAAGIGEGAAALTEWATGGRLGGDTRKFFNEISEDQVSRMGPRARRALSSEVFADEGAQSIFDDFASSLGLKTVSALPSTAASIIPAGIAVRALSAAGTATRVAAAGAVARGANSVMTGGEVAQQIFSTIDKMSDEELKQASDLYAGYRSMMSEKDARARYMPEVANAAPFVGMVIGALTPGVETTLAKRLGGEAAKGVVKGAGRGAFTEAAQELVEGASGEALSQAALVEAKLKSGMDWTKVLGQGLEGALVGVGMGAGGGALGGIGARKNNDTITPPANGVTTLPANGVDPAQAAALGAGAPNAPQPPAGIGKQKAEEIKARTRAAQQAPKGVGTGEPVQPSEVATDNPSQPTRSATEYPEGEQSGPPLEQRTTVPPRLAEVYTRLTSRGKGGAQQPGAPAPSAAATSPTVPTDIAAALQRLNPVVDDTGMNAQESPAQLAAQEEELVRGQVPAQMFPAGTEALPPPPGMDRVETPRGAFNINPSQVTPQQVQAASAAGRENEVLGLGDQNKTDVMQRAAQTGEPVVAVQTQTPDGTPVREALATTGTAPQTAAQMEAQTGKPATVKRPLEVVRQRRSPLPAASKSPAAPVRVQEAEPVREEAQAPAPQPPAAPRVLQALDDKLGRELDAQAANAERGNRGKSRGYSDNERKAFLRRAAVAVEQQGDNAPQFYRNALRAEEERTAALDKETREAGKNLRKGGRAKAGSPAAVASAKLRAAWQEEQNNPEQRAKVRGNEKGGAVARSEQEEQENEARDEARRAKKNAEPEELAKEQVDEAIRLIEADVYEQIANTSNENVKKRLREDARNMRFFLETMALDDPGRFRAIVSTLTKKVSSLGIYGVDENRAGDQLITSSEIEAQLIEQNEIAGTKFTRPTAGERAVIAEASNLTELQLLRTMVRIEMMSEQEFRDFLVDASFEEYIRAVAANRFAQKATGYSISHFRPASLKATARALLRAPVEAKEVTTLGKVLEQHLPKGKITDFNQAMIGFLHRRLVSLVGDMKVHIVDERAMRRGSGGMGRSAAAGAYRDEANDILLLDSQMVQGAAGSYWLAVHEALHGALANLISRSPKFKQQVENLRTHIKAAVDGSAELRTKFGDSGSIYGLKNADEFLSETVSNFEFQELLEAIEITNNQLEDMGIRSSLRSSVSNALKAFVQMVRNYLGTPPDSVSALEAALRVTEDGLYIREFKGAGARNSAMSPEQRSARADFWSRANGPKPEWFLSERLLSKQKPLQERVNQELRSRGVAADIAKEISEIINEEAQNGASFEQLLPLIQELADEFTSKRTAEDGPAVEGKLPSEKEFEAATASMLKALESDAAALKKSLERAPASVPWALKLRTFDNLAQRFAAFATGVNPVRVLHNLRENRGRRRAVYMKQSEPVVIQFYETEKKYKATPEGQAKWTGFAQFLNDVTMANIRPDLPLADNKHLGKDSLAGMWSKGRYAELADQYRNMDPDLKALYQTARAHLEGMYDQQGRSQLKAILNAAGIDDDALVERLFADNQTPADMKAIGPELAEIIEGLPELKKLGGAYFPLTRRGNFVVRGTVEFEKPKPADAYQFDDVTFDFTDRKKAIAFAQKQSSRPEIRTIHVDPATNERFFTDTDGTQVPVTANDADGETRYRVRVNNEIVEFADSKRAAQAKKAELEKAGVKTRDVTERKFDNLEDTSAGLPPRLRALEAALKRRSGYKELSALQKSELMAALHEIAVRMPNAKPRRNIAGASLDVSRNVYDYTTRMAGLLAKIELQPSIDAAAKQLDELVAKIEAGSTGRSVAARAIANEAHRRLAEDAKPESNTAVDGAVDRLLAISAADKLGSPAYSVVNMTQPGMLTYPVLAAKYGPVRALMAMKQAYRDVAALRNVGKGLKETGKAATGARSSTNYIDDVMARLTDAGEKKMLADLAAVRSVEADSGIEVSRLLAAREGVLGKGDAAIGWLEGVTRALPTAIEANNRTVTALAAYRLEMAKTKDQATATEYAQDVVNQTQFLYTATNTPPVMNKAGVRLVTQFMKYPQAVYQLLGDQIGKAIRNDAPGDRAAALKTIGYIAMTHAAMAGALGLPWEPVKIALAITSGLAGFGPSPDDVEEYVRKLAAQAFGKAGGEIATRGVTRGLGFDLSSRVGLDNLISFGAPRSNSEKDIKAFFFDRLAGAPGSYVADLVKAGNAAFNGEVLKTAELVIPLKVFADSLKAYRLMDEGKKSPGGRETLTPYTPAEAAVRAFGFTPRREAETSEQRRTVGGNIAQYNQQRTKLLQDYAQNPKNRAKAMIAIEKFNRGKPEDLQIGAKDRSDAEKRYQRTKEHSIGGFADTKRNRALVGDSDFYNIGR